MPPENVSFILLSVSAVILFTVSLFTNNIYWYLPIWLVARNDRGPSKLYRDTEVNMSYRRNVSLE